MELNDSPPKKLWRLMKMALEDCRAVTEYGGVEWDMYEWLRFPKRGDEHCVACVAGAVMLNRLGAEDNDDVERIHGGSWSRAFSAIDSMRCGALTAALFCLGYTEGEVRFGWIDDYAKMSGDRQGELCSPEQPGWYEYMEETIAFLKERDL